MITIHIVILWSFYNLYILQSYLENIKYSKSKYKNFLSKKETQKSSLFLYKSWFSTISLNICQSIHFTDIFVLPLFQQSLYSYPSHTILSHSIWTWIFYTRLPLLWMIHHCLSPWCIIYYILCTVRVRHCTGYIYNYCIYSRNSKIFFFVRAVPAAQGGVHNLRILYFLFFFIMRDRTFNINNQFF